MNINFTDQHFITNITVTLAGVVIKDKQIATHFVTKYP